MKVLEKGSGWSIKVRCTGDGNGDGGCNSLLQVEKNDIFITTHTDIAGDTEFFYTFRCPVCEMKTDIPEDELPYSVRSDLLDEYRGICKKGNEGPER